MRPRSAVAGKRDPGKMLHRALGDSPEAVAETVHRLQHLG